jgi:hypothetical protein
LKSLKRLEELETFEAALKSLKRLERLKELETSYALSHHWSKTDDDIISGETRATTPPTPNTERHI